MSDFDDLVTLPLDEFVAARDALAKQLKADGDPTRAAAVKKLRKPTVAEWLVAKVMRDQPLAIDALRTATQHVAAAQEAAVVEGERERLRAAIEEHRTAMSGIERAVDVVIAQAGVGAAKRLDVVRGVEDRVTAETASGTFGLRDDLELNARPARVKPPKRDAAAERRAAKARDAIAAAEARVERAKEELEVAERSLTAAHARYEKDI